jgi:hypothetical protein
MVMGRQLSCLLTRRLAVLYDVTGAIELVGPSRRFSNFPSNRASRNCSSRHLVISVVAMFRQSYKRRQLSLTLAHHTCAKFSI